MKSAFSSIILGVAFVEVAAPALADDRTQKYRSGGCEIERKYSDSGKYEAKIECKPDRRFSPIASGSGKEEFKQGGCEIKREWKQDGEYKEEVKCR